MWLVTFPNHASTSLLTVARSDLLWTHKGVDLAPLPVVGLVVGTKFVRAYNEHFASRENVPLTDVRSDKCGGAHVFRNIYRNVFLSHLCTINWLRHTVRIH